MQLLPQEGPYCESLSKPQAITGTTVARSPTNRHQRSRTADELPGQRRNRHIRALVAAGARTAVNAHNHPSPHLHGGGAGHEGLRKRNCTVQWLAGRAPAHSRRRQRTKPYRPRLAFENQARLENDGPAVYVNRIASLIDAMLQQQEKLFSEELGTIQGIQASLLVRDDAKPHFSPPRPVPYAFREKIDKELARLEKQGIIEPVRFARWATPVVPVLKKDGSIRVCGDYTRTVNKAAIVDSYPIPRIEDLFVSLAGGTVFSKLDLAHAYQQLVLDDPSKDLVVVNTHKGLYRYNRLPFGVAAAPAIFQRTMESVLRGLPNVCVYLDDILVSGSSEESHIQNLEAVLTRLEEAGRGINVNSYCRKSNTWATRSAPRG